MSSIVVFAHNDNYDAIIKKVSENKTLVKNSENVYQPNVINNNDSEPSVSNYKAGTTCSITSSASTICQGSSVTIGYTTSNVQTSGSIGQAQYTTNGGSSWTNMTPNTTNNMNYSPTSTTIYGVRVLSDHDSITCGPHYTTVTVYTKSNTAPTLTSPANHAYLYSSSVTFSWTHTLGTHPSSRYEIQIDGGSWIDKGSSQSHSATVSIGSHTWRVRYYDGCNNAYYTTGLRTFYYYGASTCGTVDHYGQDWTIATSMTLQGNHINVGAFTINSGVTVTVDPSCHYFNVEATSINIAGTINANGAGDIGGSGGGGGARAYGDNGVCNGGYGGAGGGAGAGTGGGNAGNNGGDGGCRYQICGNILCIGNRNGETGGGGGGGGGAGGSYGGTGGGSSWGARGVGYSSSGVSGGSSGSGGSPKSTYGTVDGTDINWGSGGGGGGGGGGSYAAGTSGGTGGNGGGQVSLISSGAVTISGNIYCNGTNGGNGGSGGGESLDG
ncbi:MAG TPA: hypothetical protein PK124_03935, partial [Bacteroidales bacterium]|nr:hypothetical protein [Bacteroidales bacterium]